MENYFFFERVNILCACLFNSQNGGATTSDDYYVLMSLSKSTSAYEMLEAIDVAPVALAFAFPDEEGEPCSGDAPFELYDEQGYDFIRLSFCIGTVCFFFKKKKNRLNFFCIF